MPPIDATFASRTLLMTDVVDSTQLNERLGDAVMAEVWRVHDRIARDLLSVWRGQEIDKTDGMLILFQEVLDAVGYALALHRTIAARELPIQARFGVHSGAVILRRNNDVDIARGAKSLEIHGVAVAMTMRIMSIALGGQILLSADAILGLNGKSYAPRSHGFWRLKGIAEPVELFEIVEGSGNFRVPIDVPKAYRVTRIGECWLPSRAVPHSLPAERDSFVGRRDTLQTLGQKLEGGVRLVSIVGIGGCGKTRLVTRFAWECLGDYPGGVWFCDLSQARELDDINLAVAHGLQVPVGNSDPITQLAQAIAGRARCLVILDNFEQVARHAEATVGQWMNRSPEARFLVTTREVLGIAGEQVLQLPTMSVDDAAELFAVRAAAARLGHQPNAQDAEAIRQLAVMLDGLPLAIELTAARVRVMTPRTLITRMRDRLEVSSSTRGRGERQVSLRATFDWSWDLLANAERATLAALSVFEGGFTLDSVAAVLSAGNGTSQAVDDAVQALLDKSFVHRVDDHRFDLLETVREYAARQLVSTDSFSFSGEPYASEVHKRHWRYFASMGERAAVEHRCIETRNLIAACRAASRAGDAGAATGCLLASWSALRLNGPYRAAVALADSVAALPNLGSRQRALVHWVLGDALELLGDVEAARTHLQQALAHATDAESPDCTARVLITIGNRYTLIGELDAARSSLGQAYELAAGLGDRDLQMHALNALGLHSDHQSRWKEAQAFYERALALARSLRDRRMEGGLLGNLGGLHHDAGNLEAARAHYEMAIGLASELGDRRWEGNARSNLGLLHHEQGYHEDARIQWETALALARQVGHTRLENTVLCNLGILLSEENRYAEAAQYFEQAITGAVACSDMRAQGQFKGYLAVNQARCGLVDEARASLAEGEQLLLAMADQLSHALLLCDRAEVEILSSRKTAAYRSLAQSQRIATTLECRDDSALCRRIAALRAMAKRACLTNRAAQ